MATTLLTYTIITNPFPLQAGAASASLTLMASNETSAAVSLQWLTIKIPVGSAAQQLTAQASVIAPVPPSGWNNQKPQPVASPGFFIFGFLPSAPKPVRATATPPVATIPAGTSITFILNGIQVNSTPGGPVEIDVTEGSPGNPMQPFTSIAKFPAGWGEVDFGVNPPDISVGGSTTLNWNGPVDATYTIEYSQKSVVVNIPAPGQSPLGNAGTYPGQGQPSLTPDETTVFTLNVSLSANSQSYNAQLQKTVTVAPLLPTITSFTGTVETVDDQLVISLSWETDADHCFLNDNSENLKRSGKLSFTPSIAAPLANIYTLTAHNATGSKTAMLTVVWGVTASVGFNQEGLGQLADVTDLAFSREGSQIYVLIDNYEAGSSYGLLVILDRATLQLVSSLKMANSPMGLAVSAGRAYVSALWGASSNIAAIDTSGDQPVLLGGSVNYPTICDPLVITRDGTRIFVDSIPAASELAATAPDGTRVSADGAGNGAAISVLATSGDPNAPLSSLTSLPLDAMEATGLVISFDGKKAYACSVTDTSRALIVIDTVQLAFVGQPLPLEDRFPSLFAITPDGSLIFAAFDVSPAGLMRAFRVTGDPVNPPQAAGHWQLPDGFSVSGGVVAPGSKFIYLVAGDENFNSRLTILEIATMQPVGSAVGGLGAVAGDIIVSGDGANIYVASSDANAKPQLQALAPVSFSGGTAAHASRRSERSSRGCG